MPLPSTPTDFSDVTIVSAADAGYFWLLQDLVLSLKQFDISKDIPLSIFDLGLEHEQRAWLTAHGATLKEPGWDIDFEGRASLPAFYRAMTARPYLPDYFPSHSVYLWLDADTWVQDPTCLTWFVEAARDGKVALVPELDRSYWTAFKPPKLWGQNQKAFAWSYGWRAGYEYGRNPILNIGAFALSAGASHWSAWKQAHKAALHRKSVLRARCEIDNHAFFLSEQTALNYTIFQGDKPYTLLPATANWFCAKGHPVWNRTSRQLVEPNMPYTALGIVHLAGRGMKRREWALNVAGGGTIETRLTFSAISELRGNG